MESLPLYLFLTLAILHVADAVTTIKALKITGNREVNPIMAKLFTKFGIVPSLVAAKGSTMGALYYVLPAVPLWALGGLIALYVWVVSNNLKRI